MAAALAAEGRQQKPRGTGLCFRTADIKKWEFRHQEGVHTIPLQHWDAGHLCRWGGEVRPPRDLSYTTDAFAISSKAALIFLTLLCCPDISTPSTSIGEPLAEYIAAQLPSLAQAIDRFAAPQVAEQSVELMSKETITAAVESVAKAVNIATVQARDVALWTKNSTTIKALVCLEVVRRMTPYISPFFVVFMSVNLLFTVPYVLEAKKAQIEKHVGPHFQKFKSMK
ncbi:unnamed protein product, partial [Polarella glacialis]